jgi:hypothetical protein
LQTPGTVDYQAGPLQDPETNPLSYLNPNFPNIFRILVLLIIKQAKQGVSKVKKPITYPILTLIFPLFQAPGTVDHQAAPLQDPE